MPTLPEDYSVGWICALLLEFVAAAELLDDEFSAENRPPIAAEDTTAYRFGRIGTHNVVITCLPAGQYGTSAAANAASNLLRSFRDIKIGLMVGIGGGAGMVNVDGSLKHDIRLGDVVVSMPGSKHGGVIHYDSGKNIQGRGFEETGHLMRVPVHLCNAIQSISLLHRSKGHGIVKKVRKILENKRLEFQYAKPERSKDRLYKSNYVHDSSGGICDCAKPTPAVKSLLELHPDNLVARRERNVSREDDPKVHYGLIASGDKIMKDARQRNELAAKHDILCFETEAAGLMNTFPCLIVRGIADYADSHKNDVWQPYAAATAAAYAKELLEIIPRKDLKSCPRVASLEELPRDALASQESPDKANKRTSRPAAHPVSFPANDTMPSPFHVVNVHSDMALRPEESTVPIYPSLPLEHSPVFNSWIDPSYGFDKCLNSANRPPLMSHLYRDHVHQMQQPPSRQLED